jgi:hypothetical protein
MTDALRFPPTPPVERERDTGRSDFHPDVSPTAMTIVIVGESETRQGVAAVVAGLAGLAVNDELLVIFGADECRPADECQPGPDGNAVVSGLRGRLPRYNVVALHVTPHIGALEREAAVLDEFLEIGSLPVVLTQASAVRDIAAELSSYLGADRILSVSYNQTSGTEMHPVWYDRAAA